MDHRASAELRTHPRRWEDLGLRTVSVSQSSRNGESRTFGLGWWHITRVRRAGLTHLRIPRVVSAAIWLTIPCCRPSHSGRRVRKIVPQHGNEAVRDFRAQATVQRQTLEHLDAMLQHTVLVIYGIARRQGGDCFDCKFGILEPEIPNVVADGCLLGILQATRSFSRPAIAGLGGLLPDSAQQRSQLTGHCERSHASRCAGTNNRDQNKGKNNV